MLQKTYFSFSRLQGGFLKNLSKLTLCCIAVFKLYSWELWGFLEACQASLHEKISDGRQALLKRSSHIITSQDDPQPQGSSQGILRAKLDARLSPTLTWMGLAFLFKKGSGQIFSSRLGLHWE